MTVKAALLALALTLALPSFGQYPGSLYYPKVEGGDVTFLLKADGALRGDPYTGVALARRRRLIPQDEAA